MSKQLNILILYITEHSGHHSAAKALVKAFGTFGEAANVHTVNAFKHTFPFVERLTHALYMMVIKRVPGIWEKMYDNPKFYRNSRWLKDKIHDAAMQRLRAIIKQYSPDAILCTQAFPCGIVADYKRKEKVNLPLYGVLTDFSPHAFWVYPEVNFYSVACDESKRMLIERGVGEERIKTFGIPIDPKFSQETDRQEVFLNFGLDPKIPVILLMGGGHGLGPLKETLKSLDEMDQPIQIIVVCGINRKLYEWIQKTPLKSRVLTFRYTDQVERLMSIAAVIITKPGGITTAEALSKRLPMIILRPIPGQEMRNTQMLVSKGLAVKADDLGTLNRTVVDFLKKAKGGSMKLPFLDPWLGYSKPNSATELARFVLSNIQPLP